MDTVKIIKFHPERCDECRECERACSMVHFKTKDGGDKSAIRIIRERTVGTEASGDGSKLKMTNCNHCGLCMDMCPVLALKRNPKGTIILNKNTCIGCQSCVAFCPRSVMRRAPGLIIPFKCISCGACVRACPEDALELVDVKIADVSEEVYSQWGSCE